MSHAVSLLIMALLSKMSNYFILDRNYSYSYNLIGVEKIKGQSQTSILSKQQTGSCRGR